MSKPFVTVVINSYRNDESALRRAIRGYQKQRRVRLQLVVSTVKGDPAVSVARGMSVRVVTLAQPGIYPQLNNSLRVVRGDWFAYASGNDVALPTKLIDEVRRCKKTDKLVCYSAYYFADADGNVTGVAKFPATYSRSRHMQGNFVSDLALMRRDILDEFSPFKEEFGNMAYWDFWLRVAKTRGNVFVYNARPEWIYHLRPDSQHVKRKKDPVALKKNAMLRAAMLRAHRK